MKLRITKRRTKKIAEFNNREWEHADIEHYGAPQDFSESDLRIAAYKKDEIVGSLALRIKGGVCEIKTLIVGRLYRGTGIGGALMFEAERVAQEYQVHKLWLITGKGWEAEKFYKKLGYRQNTVLPKHFAEKDFVLYEKLLK